MERRRVIRILEKIVRIRPDEVKDIRSLARHWCMISMGIMSTRFSVAWLRMTFEELDARLGNSLIHAVSVLEIAFFSGLIFLWTLGTREGTSRKTKAVTCFGIVMIFMKIVAYAGLILGKGKSPFIEVDFPYIPVFKALYGARCVSCDTNENGTEICGPCEQCVSSP